jgi:hypothetical protein
VSQARRALGDEAFGAAEAAGRALTSEEALSQARTWLTPTA